MHTKRVYKEFEIKHLSDYHDLYLRSDTLLLIVFKNFRKVCLKIYYLDFQQYKTIRFFGESICTGKTNIDKAEMDQNNLSKYIVEFINKSRPRTRKGKDRKRDAYESAYSLYEGREITLNTFRNVILPIKSIQGSRRRSDLATQIKILTPKQVLQRLPIALAQVKAGNTSEDLLNEISQIIYSLYLVKGITKKVYSNIMNSIKV